jgi:hypothetical protein
MTRDEADRLCARLGAEHPDRATHQWHAREDAGGSWSVLKIALAPAGQQDITAETRADERPATADDPRPSTFQNVPPYAAG